VYPGATAQSRQGQAGCVVVDLSAGRRAEMRWTPLEIDRSLTG
jgi:hypothetical protein